MRTVVVSLLLLAVVQGTSSEAWALPVTLVSRSATGPTSGNGASELGAFPDASPISADGRFVAFVSDATNLVQGQMDTAGSFDAFLFDRLTGAVTLLSHKAGSPTTAGNGNCDSASISADGAFVALVCTDTDLVAGQVDTNASLDVFLADRVTGTTVLVSHSSASATTAGSSISISPVLSADGRFVAFASSAIDLVAGVVDLNLAQDIFLFDRMAGTTTLVSRSTAALTPGDAPSRIPVLSGDGRFVAFESDASNLVAGQVDTGGPDVFLFDRVAGTTKLVSHRAGSPATAANNSGSSSISGDGSWIAFASTATNLVAGMVDADGAGGSDVFLFERATGTVSLVSHSTASPSTTGNGVSGGPQLSADGRFLAFSSLASDLVTGQTDPAGDMDVFLFDRSANTTKLVSHSRLSPTTGADQGAFAGSTSISADGRFVAFVSASTDLVSGLVDGNGTFDVFRFDCTTGANTAVSVAFDVPNGVAVAASSNAHLSANGLHVAFQGPAFDLVPGDSNGQEDVFLSSFRGEAGVAIVPDLLREGGVFTIHLVLSGQPAAPVTLALSTSAPSQCVPVTSSVVFDATNWQSGVAVRVAGVDDGIVDGAQPCTLVIAPAESADASFAGLDVPDFPLLVFDKPGATVFPIAGRETTERGGAGTFTVVLNSPPREFGDIVTVDFGSSDPGEGTVSPPAVTFTSADWNVPKTITVTGQDDAVVDGTVAYTIQTSLTSTDAGYAGVDPPDVSVDNLDDEVDGDGDGVVDAADNCPASANAGQADFDFDGVGDECDVDDDGDGVADEVEQAAPNGGDGNFDGVPDSRQAAVASLRTSTDRTFLTLVASACAGARFFDVRALSESAVGDDDPAFEYPLGLVLFRLSPCNSAQVTLWLHGGPVSGALFRQHPVTGPGTWSTSSAVFAASQGVTTVTRSLTGTGGLIESLGGLGVLPFNSCSPTSFPASALLARAGGVGGARLKLAAGSASGPILVGTHTARVVAEDADSITVDYVAVIENVGPAPQFDNPGPEVLTFLPPCSHVVSLEVDTGSAQPAGDQIRWDLTLHAATAGSGGGSATMRTVVLVPTTIVVRPEGFPAAPSKAATAQATWWQSVVFSDADLDGTNETLTLTDDPTLPGAVDPTPIVLQQAAPEVPALSTLGLLALAALLSAAALRSLSKGSVKAR